MKKFLKWTGIILGCLFAVGFLAFLYFIPPFAFIPSEAFIQQTAAAPPAVESIADPVTRMIAERGRSIVLRTDCSACHTPQGDEGPNVNEFLAGGIKLSSATEGSFVSRNLTPDPQTGLARRSDEEVHRVLRSGILPEGRHANYRAMPWAALSNWSQEDRYAVVTYLRQLKPVYHSIPDVEPPKAFPDPDAIEAFWAYDYGKHAK